MELENQTLEQVQAQEQVEPVKETVSTPEPIKEQPEWKAPESKEELDKLIKAAENRTYTKALKELGVTSIKDFKIQQEEIKEQLNSIGTLKENYENVQKEYETLKNDYTSLRKETILGALNVADEYREDLIKLAEAEVTEDKPFEEAVKELVEGRYKHVVATPQLRMGTERRQAEDTNTISPAIRQRYPWLNKK